MFRECVCLFFFAFAFYSFFRPCLVALSKGNINKQLIGFDYANGLGSVMVFFFSAIVVVVRVVPT